MKIIDISWPLSDNITGYKDKKEFSCQIIRDLPHDTSRESLYSIGSHAGTHVDAPAHMLADGKTVMHVPLSQLIGSCVVIDLSLVDEKITADDFVNITDLEDTIVLLKTKNSLLHTQDKFDPAFVYLTTEGAKYLVNKRIKAVGIDYLGIERNQMGHPTHKALLKNNIAIIEGLRLEHVKPGKYFFICLPLAIDGDGSPARAILIEKF